MNDIREGTQDRPFVLALAHAAVMAWLVSLALPGFVVESRTEAWFGAQILLSGLLFGWTVNGWAAYANLFFIVVASRLYSGKQPRVSVLAMLLLAATLPLFSGVIRDEGSGTVLPVVSWGWGAVLWLLSIVLLASAAAARAQILSSLGIRVLAATTVMMLVAITLVHYGQRFAANEQEREIYLSRGGMAFTRAEFCGVPFVWPAAPMVRSDEVVTLDIDPQLRSGKDGKPYLWLPKLLHYQEDGFAWTTYRDPTISSVEVKVRHPAEPRRSVLQAKVTSEGAVIRLLDTTSNIVLYEQPLRTKFLAGGRRAFCPVSSQLGPTGLTKGYDKALLRVLGQDSQQQQPRQHLRSETAHLPCNLGSEDVDGTRGLRTWDGRHVVLQPESVRTRLGFCSETYIGLVYVSTRSDTNPSDLSPVVQVFDRKTLRPLAAFNDRRPCPNIRCKEAPRDIVTGIRIDDDNAIVETSLGELVAKRIGS